MPRSRSRSAGFGAAALALALACSAFSAACDKEPTKLEQMEKTAAAPSAAPSSTATLEAKPAAPRKPSLSVDESAATLDGERFEFSAPDVRGRLLAALAGKPVAGEEITAFAPRNVKVPKVAAVVSALAGAKAKSVVVRTPKRDLVLAPVTFTIGAKREPCEAVGFIAKDGAINAWTAGGGSAALRFTHGMAGPDLTRGSEGVRKLIASCSAPAWAASADDNVTWGLLVDLILAVEDPGDAGAPPKAREVVLLPRAPTPGRKIDEGE